jgi:4-hydroxy-2-oxoheptanedioate aldolase
MFASHTLPGVPSGPRYDNGQKDGLMVIVQIETAQGLENVEKIAQVEGVDALLVGMSALS